MPNIFHIHVDAGPTELLAFGLAFCKPERTRSLRTLRSNSAKLAKIQTLACRWTLTCHTLVKRYKIDSKVVKSAGVDQLPQAARKTS